MPGLTSAVERKRERGVKAISGMSRFLLDDLGRGLRAAFTVVVGSCRWWLPVEETYTHT